MKSIRDQCDFIIKLDTDELLTLYDPDARSFSVDRRHLFDYLRSLPFDGDMYKAGFSSSSSIERGKCMDEDNVFMSSINFTPFTETSRKTFLNSKTFKSLDLGGRRLIAATNTGTWPTPPPRLDTPFSGTLRQLKVLRFSHQPRPGAHKMSTRDTRHRPPPTQIPSLRLPAQWVSSPAPANIAAAGSTDCRETCTP